MDRLSSKKQLALIVLCNSLFKPWKGEIVAMFTPVEGPGITPAHPICVPTLTFLPPSSETESWSGSSSPKLSRSIHRSRSRTKKQNEQEQGYPPPHQWVEKAQIVMGASNPLLSQSMACDIEGKEQGRDSFSQDLLLPPSHSWSRSPSPSRRSRWSLRSLLSRDSDWESCRLVSWVNSHIKNIVHYTVW